MSIRLLGLPLALLLCTASMVLAQTSTVPDAVAGCTGPRQPVSGVVRNIAGTEIPFATVTATCATVTQGVTHKTTAGASGRYTISLAPGEYRVEASSQGYGTESLLFQVSSAPGQQVPALVLKVARASFSVTVTANGAISAPFAPVTTKTNTPVLEQPFSIDTVTGEAMLQQNPQSVTSALSFSAGVQSLSANGPAVMAVDAFNLRGSAADEYLDGMRIPQIYNAVQSGPASLQLDPHDLQRIDLLLGPSSALYGQSNVGGIVDAVSKLPVSSPLHSLQFQAGSYDRYQAGGDFSGRLDPSGQFLYRVDGIFRRANTFIYGMQDNRATLNPTLSWVPSRNTRLNVYGKYLRNSSDSITAYIPYLGTVEEAPYGYLPVSLNLGDPTYDRYHKDQWMAGYSLDHGGSGAWSVRHQLRYVHMGANMHFLYFIGLMPDEVTGIRANYNYLPLLQGVESDTHAQRELRTGPVRNTILGGVDFQWQQYRYRQAFGVGSPIEVAHPAYGQGDQIPTPTMSQRQTQFQGGLYGQEQANISHFTFIAGGRVDFTSQDTFDLLAGAPVSSQSPHAFSGHAGVTYHVKGIAPYFSYSTSFLPTLGANLAGQPYVPVTGSNLEGGLKLQLSHLPLMFRISGFSMREQNVLQPDPANPVSSIQTGEVHTPGFDLQANGTMLHSLDYIISYTHIVPVNSISTVNQGEQPIAVADNVATAWLHYTIPHGLLTGAGIGAGARGLGSSWADPANTLRVPGFALFDASVDYTRERWRFAVNLNNVGNRRYVNGCSGASFCSYGEPLSVIGTATLHF